MFRNRRGAEPETCEITYFDIDDKLVRRMKINAITKAVIGAAMEVHRTLGPGLLESAYTQCLSYQPGLRKIPFALELPLPVRYKASWLNLIERWFGELTKRESAAIP